MISKFYSQTEIAYAEAEAAEAYKHYVMKYREWELTEWWQFATRKELKNESDRAFALWQELLRVVENMKVQNAGDILTDETLDLNSGLESSSSNLLIIALVGVAAVYYVYKFL